jgi:hypothetical protein
MAGLGPATHVLMAASKDVGARPEAVHGDSQAA